MTQQEKLNLYNRAKEAYYNGVEIISDYEFDELEKELGLENKSYIGAHHNPSYTVQHPYLMGSLAKVQIHRDNEGNINWEKYFTDVNKYVNRNNNNCEVIVTPKYDGCSFELYYNHGNVTISSRGDGEFGQDLSRFVLRKFKQDDLDTIAGEYTLRGEILVDKNVYAEKYSQFTNPRSFVSGVLNRDTFDTQMVNDLSVVVYDYRVKENGIWVDKDWTELNSLKFHTPEKMYQFKLDNVSLLEGVYNEFDNYRKECKYALDGIVIKPIAEYRENDLTERRPKDCVAIKFIPMLEPTTVTSITWKLGKTHELIPIINVEPVEMDGRMVTKCSGHNYGYLLDKHISVGTKVVLSLAGDIIPFLYKVTDDTLYNIDNIQINEQWENYEIDGVHAKAILNEKEINRLRFINSSVPLNIPTIGKETAKDIYDYVSKSNGETDDFFDETPRLPWNILLLTPEEIYFGAGGKKAGKNAQDAFKKVLNEITLCDIIKSCNFKLCGDKVATQVEKYLLNDDYDFTSMAYDGYRWAMDNNSSNYNDMMEILNHLGKSFDDFKVKHEETIKQETNQIPVILTGEPNDYRSKGEFLKAHPEYRMTGSWKEVQIVFTNDLTSTTGKMKKAKEKNIEIRLY